MEPVNKTMLQISINTLISGFLYGGGEVQEIPEMLRIIAADYELKIKEHLD